MKKTILTIMLAAAAIVGCKKTTTSPSTFSLTGSWVGTWNQTNPAGSNTLTLSFQNVDNINLMGILQEEGNTFYPSSCLYTVTDSVRFKYRINWPSTNNPTVYIGALKYSNNSQTMGGTYHDSDIVTYPNDHGTLSLTRQ